MKINQNTGLKVSILASGSSGNCLYIETPKQKLLMDAGLSGKKITALLSSINRRPEELDGILVTHEHTDHIKGVGILARKYHLDVYANEKTWQAMEKPLGNLSFEQKHLFERGKTKTFQDLDIESFGVSHDAACPQFYRFVKDNRSFVALTDTGYCSDALRFKVKDANAYLIESNHDVDLLRAGHYPWHLKQRILSDKGHLSNEDSAQVMTEVVGNQTKRIYLGHLSKENNMKPIAHLAMEDILKKHDIGVGYDVKVYDTDPEKATDLFLV